jgi:Pirin
LLRATRGALPAMTTATTRPYLVLRPEDHVVLGEAEFGMPGLVAVEAIGSFAAIQASGPLITVHDSTIAARLGIGHHPYRYNERLFYIEQGQLDHDDALNHITGHMDTGDVGQFTEGRPGMVHSEWNHGEVDTRAYILVYSTDPIPDQTAFNVLRDADAARYERAPGVHTKELAGPRSPLRVTATSACSPTSAWRRAPSWPSAWTTAKAGWSASARASSASTAPMSTSSRARR